MPGFRGYQNSLQTSELDELLPVVFDQAHPKGHGSSRPARFSLTEAGRRSLLTRLEPDDNENERVWNGLPGFQWYAAAQRAKIGSQVLATHDSDSTTFGRVPLIVTRTVGTGQSAVHGHRRRMALAKRRRRLVSLSLLGPGRSLDGVPAKHVAGRIDAAVLFT